MQARLPKAATEPLASAFGTLAGLRRARALHPRGEVWRGLATVEHAGGALTGGARTCPATVRLSRAVGLPSPLPDIHGVAVRFRADQEIDVLLASSSRSVPWLLVPTFASRTLYSSLAHYELDGRKVRLFGRVTDQEIVLWAAERSHETPLAGIRLDERTDEPIRFRPEQTGPRLRPVGTIHALRPASYRASRERAPVDTDR